MAIDPEELEQRRLAREQQRLRREQEQKQLRRRLIIAGVVLLVAIVVIVICLVAGERLTFTFFSVRRQRRKGAVESPGCRELPAVVLNTG